MKRNSRNYGFTLVEMIVSIGLFTIILFIATSAFLAVVNADRKSRATRIAADNLNLALEDMERRIRTGSSYYCGTGGEASSGTADCPVNSPANQLSFIEQDGKTRTTYRLIAGKIEREQICITIPCTDTSMYNFWVPATAPETTISALSFNVQGSTPGVSPSGDSTQPYVTILIDGSITNIANPTLGASFNIQTTVTQRNYDS